MPFHDYPCRHRFRTVARDVTACLSNNERTRRVEFASREDASAIRYQRLVFCSDAGCDCIFEAVPAATGVPIAVRF